MRNTAAPAGARGRARASAISLFAGSALLLGCSTDPEATQGPSFDSVEGLYGAVDEVLQCPVFENNDVQIALPDDGFLDGLTCGEGMVLAWSEDTDTIEEAREMMIQSSESRPAVQGPGWFVVDAEDAVPADSGDGPEPFQPNSRDLNALAEELGAEYTEY